MTRCTSAFVVTALAVAPYVANASERDGSNPWQTTVLWIFISLAYGLVSYGLSTISVGAPKHSWRRFAYFIPLLMVAAARALEIPGFQDFARYGDSLSSFLVDNEDMGRWLLGFAAAREIYDGVNSLFTDVASLTFVRFSGSLLMAAWGYWIVSRRGSDVAPWVVVLSPLWVLFSVGHDEYYPLIAGLVLALAWQIISGRQLFERNTNYVLSGVLPALYIGAAPLSVSVLLFAWGRERATQHRVRGALVSLVSFMLSIEVGGEFKGYFKNLTGDLNLNGFIRSTEGSLEDNPAAVTGTGSFFASPSYVFTKMHLLDIVFWLICGAGLTVVILALSRSLGTHQTVQSDSLVDSAQELIFKRIARATLVISAILFLIFMLPQLGPTSDIDLYFWSLFIILLFAGSQLDRWLHNREDLHRLQMQFIQLFAIGFAPATTALVIFGVARY